MDDPPKVAQTIKMCNVLSKVMDRCGGACDAGERWEAGGVTAQPHSIGDVAKLTGVSTSTLRAWEVRYQLLTPNRTDAAYRKYSERDVETIRRMRLLVDSGVPARRAAVIAREPADPAADAPPRQPGAPLIGDHDALVNVARRYDPVALRSLLDEAFAVANVERVIDDWLMPSLARLGEQWKAGSVDVAVEHFLTAAVMRRLSALFEATPAQGARVIVGLPPGSRHELPALAFAVCLRRAGIDALYLGADVPLDSWTAVIDQTRPHAVVIAASTPLEVPAAQLTIQQIRRAGVAAVYVGGRSAASLTDSTPLPHALHAAAVTVAAALNAPKPGG